MQTNTELENKVLNELKKEPLLKNTQLNVRAIKGVVILTGAAETYEIKIAAKTVARRIPGVTTIKDRIKLKSGVSI
jgi:osmotically-inducible protein OsmY